MAFRKSVKQFERPISPNTPDQSVRRDRECGIKGGSRRMAAVDLQGAAVGLEQSAMKMVVWPLMPFIIICYFVA